jgi:leukotriene-A4 hydrolase
MELNRLILAAVDEEALCVLIQRRRRAFDGVNAANALRILLSRRYLFRSLLLAGSSQPDDIEAARKRLWQRDGSGQPRRASEHAFESCLNLLEDILSKTKLSSLEPRECVELSHELARSRRKLSRPDLLSALSIRLAALRHAGACGGAGIKDWPPMLGLRGGDGAEMTRDTPQGDGMLPDLCSLSNPQHVRMRHMHMSLEVDFRESVLSGTVEFSAEVLVQGATSFDLDTRTLTIKRATVEGMDVEYSMGKADKALGSRLSIPLDVSLRAKGARLRITVEYATSPSSSACQWLPPAQTAGKKRPYLFTQCQAIHARSLLPCQDAPGAKVTWSAHIVAPAWATVLMSAVQDGRAVDGASTRVFAWKQLVPTSTYLIAIAVGDLESRDISPRCRVWSEPIVVDKVQYEFAETEKFLAAAESLTCPYQWGRYDVLCLPPSFPYGGMENPCLTFVTPTLLAGDRSLTHVVAHEIAHSWTGNLVTNANWDHFWLNEGWTVWLERRIMMRVRGAAAGPKGDAKYFSFLASSGWSNLKDAVEHFTELKQGQYTRLVQRLEGIDPDDAFSAVPYEKGFSLLYAIQRRVGDDAFEDFAKDYIATFKSRLVSSLDFKVFVTGYRGFQHALADLDWDMWFNAEGMPAETPTFDDSLSSAATKQATCWVMTPEVPAQNSPQALEMKQEWDVWSSKQKCYMLDKMLELTQGEKARVPTDATLQNMQAMYDLSRVVNTEIRFRWCTLCLRGGAEWIVPAAIELLSTQGRMKFTRPLYREMIKSPSQLAAAAARRTFETQAYFYHPICRKMVEQDFKAHSSLMEYRI